VPANEPRRGILCAGNFIVDRVALIDRYPPEDTLANVESSRLSNGGAALNALCDLARLETGVPLEALGCVGDDAEGRVILDECRRLGVDTRALRVVPGAQTSYSDIMTVRSTGRRTIFHLRGANARLGREHFDFEATRARVCHLAFIALLDRLDEASPTHGTVAAEVLAAARAAGLVATADVVSDTSGRLGALTRAALPHLDVLFVNETEAELVTGVRARGPDGALDRDRLARAGQELLAGGLRGTVVLHTAEGALALTGGGAARWQGSVRVPREAIAGTNGAGDAFAAGFLYALHERQPLEEALRVATCVAAASLLDSTPSDGVRPLAACLALGERHGFRP
jgi:sugar/nucleoside kinase (ribokinase family)